MSTTFFHFLSFIPLSLSITNHVYNCLVVTRIYNKGCFIKNDSCMPSQSLTSMGLLWRCYTMEMASFRLTQMTPSTPDRPIRGVLMHHTISANHKELQFSRQRQHPLTKLIRVEPHKYDPFSKSCKNDIKFGKSQNSIQIPFIVCLRIHCLADETHRTGLSNL